MLRFLLVDAAASAVLYAEERGWTRIGAARYVTGARDDIRVVERPLDVFFTPGGIILERGPGYEDLLTSPDAGMRARAEVFEKMVEDGAARWFQ